jgi:head-tail adaptor
MEHGIAFLNMILIKFVSMRVVHAKIREKNNKEKESKSLEYNKRIKIQQNVISTM